MPEKYYLKDLVTTDHMQKLTVPRGDKVELAYNITQPGSLLRCIFADRLSNELKPPSTSIFAAIIKC